MTVSTSVPDLVPVAVDFFLQSDVRCQLGQDDGFGSEVFHIRSPPILLLWLRQQPEGRDEPAGRKKLPDVLSRRLLDRLSDDLMVALAGVILALPHPQRSSAPYNVPPVSVEPGTQVPAPQLPCAELSPAAPCWTVTRASRTSDFTFVFRLPVASLHLENLQGRVLGARPPR